MPFYIVKTASKIYLLNTAGTATELTMPSGITVVSGRRQRLAVLDRQVVAVNGTSQPLWVDPNGATPIMRAMAIPTPAHPPLLSTGAAGGLTGAFNARVAYLVKNAEGDVIAHGPFSALSSDVTVTAQKIAVSNIPVAPHAAVNCRRLSRSTVGPGDTQFEWLDIDDNTTVAIEDDLADEALSTLPVDDELGMPPADLEFIVEWKRRLWGKSRNSIDALFFSGDGAFYAWPAANEIPIPPFGNDTTGISGFIRRRDELAIGRLDRIWKIIGDDPDNFARVTLVEGVGIIGPDSVVVEKDIGYWLAADGVYSWGPKGVAPESARKVHPWFATDDYFNRALFSQAVGWWDQRFGTYNLLLAAVGGSTLNRWVVWQVEKDRWFGPHKTDAFTTNFAALMQDSNANAMPVLCATNGHVYKLNQSTISDDGTAIDFDTRLRHTGKTPDIEKVFLQMSLLSRVEAGGTLQVIPALGGFSASTQATISADLTRGRQRLRHISTLDQGVGRILTLRFRNAENSQAVHLYGYEIPFHESGRR